MSWRPATTAEVAAAGMVGRFKELLSSPLGTVVTESAGGKRFKLEVYKPGPPSKFTKDVRGFVGEGIDAVPTWAWIAGGLVLALGGWMVARRRRRK